MTLEQQLFLTEKALYLYECLAFKNHTIPQTGGLSDGYVKWQSILDREYEGAFEKRLLMQGVHLEDASKLCTIPKIDAPAEWTKELEKILCILPACQAEILSLLNYGISENLTGVYAYLSPILLYIQREMADIFQPDIISEKACADIMKDFLELVRFIFGRFNIHMLNKMAGSILPQPIENLSEYYDAFTSEMLNGGLEHSFLEFPCLARCLIETLTYRMAYVRELISNFIDDKPCSGIITGLEMSKGDVHNYGRSVVIAEFDYKNKIVYKPQGGEVFTAYNQFLDQLIRKHILCDMKYAKVMAAYRDHCYIEFIEHRAVSDIDKGMEKYYYRVGQLACLFYVLGSEDMHYENIIAHGEYPVVVDLETLLTAKADAFVNTESSRMDFSADGPEMVTRSMLLTVGGILGGAALSWRDGKNMPYLINGDEIDFHAAGQNMLNGFNDAYTKILANRKEISVMLCVFRNCRFRSIIRATQTYCDMLGHLQYVKYLGSGLNRSFEVERLFAAYRKCGDSERLKQLYPVFEEECKAILRGDVPLFWVNGDGQGICSDRGLLDADFFKISPLDHAKLLLQKMGEEDHVIQNKVIGMIIRSVEQNNCADFIKPLEKTDILTDQKLVEEAESIFDRIKERQVFWGKQCLFLNVHTTATGNQKGRSSICTAYNDLYSGTLGIALFCGALYAVTQKQEYKKYAAQIIENAYDEFIYIPNRTKVGIAEEVGGLATVLYYLADYLHQSEYREMACKIIEMPSDLSEITMTDYLGGLSGYIVTAHRVNADVSLIEQAADRLLQLRTSYQNFYVWKSSSSTKPLTGMGHGLSGVALALAKAYELLHKEEYLLGTMDALEYESYFYDEEGGWPDLRDGRSGFMAGLCSGAPGVGLSRLAMTGISKELDDLATRDINRAVWHSGKNFPLKKDDVCCGNASGIDFLITAGRKANDHQLLSDARRRMSWVIERKNEIGVYGYDTDAKLELLGFFDGICGIGYEMLRLASDEVKGIF